MLLDKIIFDSKNVSSQRLRGGASHAPVLPLSTKVDTLFMKVSKQADTKDIGKGLFLSADNSETQVLRRRKAATKHNVTSQLLRGGAPRAPGIAQTCSKSSC